ncbi:MAG: signal peptidase I [Clostridiales bacterium GWF2_38_85]|nr:MAG: signal peptidase I [Clostridiales bacterium GWF2_38_85]
MKQRIVSSVIDLIDIICSAIFLMLILFIFVFKYVTVIGDSMNPTLHENDKLIISGMFYTPQQGDIIVIDEETESEPLIKRVIATEGQVVDIDPESWTITVDGVKLDEDYTINKVAGLMAVGSVQFPYTVEEGKIFVMGDNRNNSKDSRMLGALDVSQILGRVIVRVVPFDQMGKVK